MFLWVITNYFYLGILWFSFKKQTNGQNLSREVTLPKIDAIFLKYGRDVTMMTPLTQS